MSLDSQVSDLPDINRVREGIEIILRNHNPPLKVNPKYSGILDYNIEKGLREHNGNIRETIQDLANHIISDYENNLNGRGRIFTQTVLKYSA